MKDEAVFSGEDSSLTPVSAFDPDTGLGQNVRAPERALPSLMIGGQGQNSLGQIGQKPTQVGRVSAF
jgi:hypothetical protein